MVPMYLLYVVFTPSPPSHHSSVWVLPIISLLLTNTLSPMRACLSICWERFRGTQKEDDRGPLIFNPLCSYQYRTLPHRHLPFSLVAIARVMDKIAEKESHAKIPFVRTDSVFLLTTAYMSRQVFNLLHRKKKDQK
jgi:hypothetical protein